MAFVNLSILALGGLLVAVPIVLHLLLRQQPRRVVFPALQFVRQRRDANRRRLQLRHWLLLLLRCAAILLLAAALARPSVATADVASWLVIAALSLAAALVGLLAAIAFVQGRHGPLVVGLSIVALVLAATSGGFISRTIQRQPVALLGQQQAPVAAVLVFDSSPRMQYVHQNKTRLQEAQERGAWLLSQLPPESEFAVLDSSGQRAYFAVDRAAAARVIKGLESTNVPVPLVDTIQDAIRLVRQSDKSRKEIYVLSDLTAGAWESASSQAVHNQLAQSENVLLYVVDVGIDEPKNWWLGLPRMASTALSENGDLRLNVELSCRGEGGERNVELYVEKTDEQLPIIVDGEPIYPEPQLRNRQTVQVPPRGGSQSIDFTVHGLDLGIHHGYVKIAGHDGLALDDSRHFTVQVRPAWSILVVAAQSAVSRYLTSALQPDGFLEADFRCQVIGFDELPGTELEPFSAVVLLDPPQQPDATWESLAEFTSRGGGVAIFLGENADKDSFNQIAAQKLLPGRLDTVWRAGASDLSLAPRNYDHPILAALRTVSTSVPWDQLPVYRHWGMDRLVAGASVIVRYGNDQPAIIEHRVGEGNVLTMTTPVSDPLNRPGRAPWNMIPTGPDSWPFVILSNEMMKYLVRSGESPLNYLVGQTAELRLPPSPGSSRCQVFTPRGDWQEMTLADGAVHYPFTAEPGAYRLKGDQAAVVAGGFSVNFPTSVSRLDRVSRERLDQILGPDAYRLARDQLAIDRGIDEARVGREFYPFLIVMLVLVLGLEHVFSNLFYRPAGATIGNAGAFIWPTGRGEGRAEAV